MGRLAKTDTLDAEVIALFAERVRPQARPLREPERVHLAEPVGRRRQIIEMIGMETNRGRQAIDKPLARGLARHVAYLQKELDAIDHDIGDAIKHSPEWREAEALSPLIVLPIAASSRLTIRPLGFVKALLVASRRIFRWCRQAQRGHPRRLLP